MMIILEKKFAYLVNFNNYLQQVFKLFNINYNSKHIFSNKAFGGLVVGAIAGLAGYFLGKSEN